MAKLRPRTYKEKVMKENLRKYLVEFIGTFFLVFTVGSTLLFGGNGVVPAVAIGFALMIMVYAGGHISGGHYNPAVSLAAVIRGALPASQWLPYAVAQIVGGVAAAFVVNYIVSPETYLRGADYSIPGLVIGEFLFTYALCYVVLLTATSRAVNGNSYYGLAIGSAVMVGAFSVGGTICLGAFNPAVAVSLGIMHAAFWKMAAITVLVNFLAAAAAAVTFKTVTYNE